MVLRRASCSLPSWGAVAFGGGSAFRVQPPTQIRLRHLSHQPLPGPHYPSTIFRRIRLKFKSPADTIDRFFKLLGASECLKLREFQPSHRPRVTAPSHQAGRWESVDHLVAVSGGAYIASAFASTVLNATAKPGASSSDEVGKTTGGRLEDVWDVKMT